MNDQSARRDDAMSHEGFIARAHDQHGLKQAVKEAARLLVGFTDKEALDAASAMSPKVRTAVIKMVNARSR